MGEDIYALEGNTALYEVLGVERGATDKEIRRAYYKLAALYHPDKNPDGGDIFKEICFAHSILSDPEQRALYDSKSLRQNLQGRAKEYDPAMDPRVQLSPEDLRCFVERVRAAQEAKQKDISEFEKRREEEMRRRAEYDAKNPGFREEYERQRGLRLRGGGPSAPGTGADRRDSTRAAASQLRPSTLGRDSRDGATRDAQVSSSTSLSSTRGKTSAELVAELQKEEEKRLYGIRTGAAPQQSTALMSIKRQMMSQFRAAHQESGKPSSRSLAESLRRGKESAGHLPFVASDTNPSYSEEIEQKVARYSNFDYLTFVERDLVDGGAMEGAILADALETYDARDGEKPKSSSLSQPPL